MDGEAGGSAWTPDNAGRIPKVAAEATVILLYILALAAASLRTAIRYHYHKLQWLDDGFVVGALVFMTVGLGLFFAMLDDLYLAEALIYDTIDAIENIDFNSITQIAIRVQIYTTSYNILCISGIFAIKFSFLFFFRNILSRIRPLTLWWRCVTVYVAVAWAFSVGFSVFGCPYVDERATNCGQGDELWKAIDASIVLIVFDISTDLCLISIPILILKHVKLPLQKKLYLSGSLCLSAVMIVVAILQAATLTYMGVDAIDVSWELYFQFVELTLAIMVVSITAFRAFFVQRGSRNQDSPRTPSSWSSGTKRYRKYLNKVWPSTSTEERSRGGQMPSLTSPELSGMRTIVLRNSDEETTTTGVHTVIGRGDPEPMLRRESGHEKPDFQTDAYRGAQYMHARVEPPGSTPRTDARDEYHRIRRIMDNEPNDSGVSTSGGDAPASPSAMAMAAADALDLEACDVDPDGYLVPSTQRVTPVSASPAPSNDRTNTPSPVSPIAERHRSEALAPPRLTVQTQRRAGKRHEALRAAEAGTPVEPSPPLAPPPPAARPWEHSASNEPAAAPALVRRSEEVAWPPVSTPASSEISRKLVGTSEEQARRASRQSEDPSRRPSRQSEDPSRRPSRQSEDPSRRPSRQSEDPSRRPSRQSEESARQPSRALEGTARRPSRQLEDTARRPSRQSEDAARRPSRASDEHASQPAPRRLSHIAAQALRSHPQGESAGGTGQPRFSSEKTLPPSPAPNSQQRPTRRSNAAPEMRESGLKRAISASFSRAWDFNAQKGEGDSEQGGPRE